MEENTERDHEHKWSRVDIGLLGGSDTVCTVCGVSKWSLAERSEDADAGGRWTVQESSSLNGHGVLSNGDDEFEIYGVLEAEQLRDYLNAAETARREAEATHTSWQNALRTAQQMLEEAEQKRDRLQEDIKLLTNELRESELETGRQNARAAAAEAELAAFREKARLADEYRKSRTNMVLMGMPLSASEKSWCDRYDALTPAPEGGTA